MIIQDTKEGTVLRVRLTPNSSSCLINGVFNSSDGIVFLKVNVVSVPEKGKANAELIKLLSKKLKISKSNVNIIFGELDRYKRVLLTSISFEAVDIWLQKELKNGK